MEEEIQRLEQELEQAKKKAQEDKQAMEQKLEQEKKQSHKLEQMILDSSGYCINTTVDKFKAFPSVKKCLI